MSSSDWDHYEIPLSPQPARRPTAAPVKSASNPLAGRDDRLFAQMLDLGVGLLPTIIRFLLRDPSGESAETTKQRLILWIGSTVLIVLGQSILLSFRGQTLGKMAMSVKIVDFEDDSNPGFMLAVVWRNFIPALIAAIPCVGAVFVLLDILSIFGEERRCLHDRIAGTKVVEN